MIYHPSQYTSENINTQSLGCECRRSRSEVYGWLPYIRPTSSDPVSAPIYRSESSPTTLTSSLLHKNARHSSTPRPSYLLFPLTRRLFCQMATWLAPSSLHLLKSHLLSETFPTTLNCTSITLVYFSFWHLFL